MRILLVLIFLFSANSILAADKGNLESTLVLQQQVVELQKEVTTLKSMLEKVVADQNRQQSYIQIIKNELVVDAAKNATISAKDQLVLKSGEASIVLKKNGDISISGNIYIRGEKFDFKNNNDVSVKGSKIVGN
jgi:type VI secretion system secreted protein VgrG